VTRRVSLKAKRDAVAESAVRALAEQFGVTVYAGGGGWFEVLLEAPAGSRFEPELHELVIAGNPGERPGLVWSRALARLSASYRDLEPCDDPDCEWCGRGGA
jgi:hypothetical protein